jgi:hypothetical protein
MPTGVPAFSAYPDVLHAAFAALAAVCIAVAGALLAGRVGFWSLWCTYALSTAAMACGLAAVLPGASYVLLLPAIVGLLFAARHLLTDSGGWAWCEAASLSLLCVMFLLLWPILVPLYQGLGRPALLLVTVLLVFAAVPLVGLLMHAAHAVRRAALVLSGAVWIISVAGAVALPAYTPESPETLNIRYLLDRSDHDHDHDHDQGLRARWVILSESHRIPPVLQRVAHFAVSAPTPFNPPLDHWYGSPVIAAPAPLVDLPLPTLAVLSSASGASPGRKRYRVRVAPQRPSAALQLAFPPTAAVDAVLVQPPGTVVEPPVHLRLLHARAWTVMTLVNPPTDGQVLEFESTAAPFRVTLLDVSHGLPATGQALLDARPSTTIARHYGSVTGVAVSAALPMR